MNWKNDTSLTTRSNRKGCSDLVMADYKKSSVHCHSTMCDGKNTLQEMASAACAQGLTTLGFSGHSYTQRDREYCMSPSRTAQYKATIAKLKAEYKGKVDILCGIEWDSLSEDSPRTTITGSVRPITCTARTPASITRSTSARRTCGTASTTTSTPTRWPLWKPTLPRWKRWPPSSRIFWPTST